MSDSVVSCEVDEGGKRCRWREKERERKFGGFMWEGEGDGGKERIGKERGCAGCALAWYRKC